MEARAEDACYLRKFSNDLYQVWLPESNKITTTGITDFIVQQQDTPTPVQICRDEEKPEIDKGGKEKFNTPELRKDSQENIEAHVQIINKASENSSNAKTKETCSKHRPSK